MIAPPSAFIRVKLRDTRRARPCPSLPEITAFEHRRPRIEGRFLRHAADTNTRLYPDPLSSSLALRPGPVASAASSDDFTGSVAADQRDTPSPGSSRKIARDRNSGNVAAGKGGVESLRWGIGDRENGGLHKRAGQGGDILSALMPPATRRIQRYAG